MASVPGIEGGGGPLARLFGDGSASGMGERELLRRFADDRDPVAMEVLVARHGPMVLGVCRRVLVDRHSSEDAFQATFLVLARRAGTIRDPDRLGPWLHGVAHRVALRARADLARRQARERPGAEGAAMATSPGDGRDSERLELRLALDEEVRRLPEKFRDPIILCYLDGLTHDEAAARLRCPVGTVRSRLSTGRATLRDRLGRRGVAVPSGVSAATLAAEGASAAVTPALQVSTVKAATAFAGGLAGASAAGMASAVAASLAEGVTTTMIVSKLKIVAGAALAGMLTLGVGTVAAYQFAAGEAGGVKVEKPADETLDALIAKLKDQAGKAEARTRQLEGELRAALRELDASKARPKDATKGAGARSAGEAGGIGGGGVVVDGAPGPGAGGGTMAGGPGMAANGPAPAGMMGGRGGMSDSGGYRGGMMGGGSGGMSGMMGGMNGMGGGSGGMASMMGGMNGMGGMLGGSKSIASIQSDDYVIVHKPKADKVAAYSTMNGEWTSYQVPIGTDVVPIASSNVVALNAIGEEIGQIAAYVPAAGRWFPIDLKEPAKGHATPLLVQNQAVYAIGRRVYAFSVPTRSWDVLELPEGARPAPVAYPSRATVEHDDHMYIFSVKTGKWTDFDAKAGRVVAPGGR